MKLRSERDSIGSMAVPEDAYYGVQTLRAVTNFPITGRRMCREMIVSLAQVKLAAALVHREAGRVEPEAAHAIVAACREIIAGGLMDAFIVDPIQGGAGTSANMNMNEVVANRAIELMGGRKGDYALVHPNDLVNMAQSTNDVFPTAGKLAALKLLAPALDALNELCAALEDKGEEFDDVIKMGRTQLQDAVPMNLGQSFRAWASAVRRDVERLSVAGEGLLTINLGGTAIGTAVNTYPAYRARVIRKLSEITGEPLVQAADLMDATQNLDSYVNLSAALKTSAVNLSKIANDLRLLSSGPRTGLGEINLPARQNGSSIMPGKVNPVIPEVVSQVAFNIIGNDFTITMAAEAGQLELNAFEPVLFDNLFESLRTLTAACTTFRKNCIEGITANRERCRKLVMESTGVATALCPYIGYQKAAELAKKSLKTGVPLPKLALEEHIMNAEKLEKVLDPSAMTHPLAAD
ncbi:aspartate ammonia-lyase [Gehongia tenuis]|uniref:aspartate ammonia-lyase n=1 Tax=Gehongia tenuis TaxID=2763655 RepID=A0A926D6W9_9FIRM|nr:aspartate ammonia-lyase [Gehongia tenuis]MBC8531959.1 aspartate ammonia-lyase [Gehongia tenuis]